MKLMIFLSLVFSVVSWARLDDMANFNSALMEDVNKDVRNDNIEDFKSKDSASRGPASVKEVHQDEVPEVKSEKLNQLGTKKW